VRAGDRVLEVGTGSGHIAAELVRSAKDVVATDINPHAAACARQNGVEVVRNDLLCGIRGTFDLVIFNPPYLPTQADERIDDWLEYALDGGVDGRAVIERFAAGVERMLVPGGRILLLVSSLTGLSEVRDIFSRQGFTSGIVLEQKVEDESLYVLRIIKKEQADPLVPDCPEHNH
jgi:release factor glutamine methyltransferase